MQAIVLTPHSTQSLENWSYWLRVVSIWEQLIEARLFPASWKRPETAFTFTALRHFHILSLTSKITPYDYVRSLSKLTDSVFPQDVENRLREFQRAMRFWRSFTLQRRTGQAYPWDRYVPHRNPHSLTIRCPACPEVGYNMTKEEMDNIPEDKRHLGTKFNSLDGNFKLQRKKKPKKEDPEDIAINDGDAYCVDSKLVKAYIDAARPPDDFKPEGNCNHLRADRLQDIAKLKTMDVTGVVACQCARHGLFEPGGIVDLKKGEAYVYTDLALLKSVSEYSNIRWIVVTYDIWCQYHINLAPRTQEIFKKMAIIVQRITGAIPKMHIHNHKDLCGILWNLNWLANMGLTVGELIEAVWAELNIIAASTREMNAGNRHDSIDDACVSWNWDKLVHMADTLTRLYITANSELRRCQTALDGIVASVPEEIVASWNKMDISPQLDSKGDLVYSVFQVNFGTDVPTQQAAYAKMKQEEREREKSQGEALAEAKSDTDLVALGLWHENQQFVFPSVCSQLINFLRIKVRRLVKAKADAVVLRVQRTKLAEDIRDYHELMLERVPLAKTFIGSVNFDQPEHSPLFIPSDFDINQRKHFEIMDLAHIEMELRVGAAYEKIFLIRIQTSRVRMRQPGAQKYLRNLDNDTQIEATGYMAHLLALHKLGLPKHHPDLKPLERSHLYGTDGKPLVPGSRKAQESWIWAAGRREGSSIQDSAAWSRELDRVKYFQRRAFRDRCLEEIEIIREEFTRVRRAFLKTADIWSLLSESPDVPEPGRRAYAIKQANQYMGLAVRLEKTMDLIPEKLREAEMKEQRQVEKETQRLAALMAKKAAKQKIAPEEDEELWEADALLKT
ncbi:hypothetical protein MIND_01011700 [Mycena indigotica]|uniref:CxC2-like cysteine cluster KDZ transposase-associated domain-containing protein n=1 Tax=Mycena indigotica TaxID=2126181 RepID=A0A8H6S9D4_9AGAR|nr:uncharacterized protein MIND_01011700 [Mycena indigotica]KAF7294743.1 hypothetical protein MIND_01011700 [Mycena indigotica]